MFTAAVFTVHLQLAVMLTYWTPLHHVGIYLGCGRHPLLRLVMVYGTPSLPYPHVRLLEAIFKSY